MRYGVFGFFIALWALSALITGAVTGTPANVSAAGGSSQAFEDSVNSVFNGQEFEANVSTSSNPVSAATSFGTTAVDWVKFIFNSAALNSPIWEGWATPIRWMILVFQLPFLIMLLLEGAKILSGFIPFT